MTPQRSIWTWTIAAIITPSVFGCTGSTGTTGTTSNNDQYGYATNNNNYGGQPAQPYSFQRALSDAVVPNDGSESKAGVLKNAAIPLTAKELADKLDSSPGKLVPEEDEKFKHIIRAGDKIPRKSYLSKFADDYSLDLVSKGPSKPPVSIYRLSFDSGKPYLAAMAVCTSNEAKKMWYGESGLRNTWRSGLAALINRSPGGCVPCLKVAEDLSFEKVTQGARSTAITHAILSTDIPAETLDSFLQSLALKNMQGLDFVGIQPMEAKELVTTCR